MRRILVALFAFAFLSVAGLVGFALMLNSKVGDIKTEDFGLTGAKGGNGVGEDGTGQDAEATEKIVSGAGENYLVIGSDARAGETFSRSDVIILAHVTEKKDKVYLIHFPRDLYVDIPGRSKDKINAAFAYGGAPLLVRTLEGLVGVTVDHGAKIDFEGFKAMTDAVGGVRVWAEEASVSDGVPITKGWNDLNGSQALTFVRERYQLSEGDISRGRRQLAFVKALMIKALDPTTVLNPLKLNSLLNAVTENAVVDESMTPKFMRSQILSMRNVRGGDIAFITAPFSGYGTSPTGGAIDVVDEARMESLKIALQNDDMATYLSGG
jgi:LCP family protein required for cell wall assembly